MAEHLTRRFGLRFVVENDANALAVGEKHFGAAKAFDHFAVITLGTGIGGGFYIGGRLNRGAHWFANAFGHIPLHHDGIPCNCGRRGCLEVYANAAALLRYGQGKFTSVERLLAAASAGDAIATAAIEELGTYLARGCAALVGLLDPQAIILSGGLATNNSILLTRLVQELQPLVPVWERRQLHVLESQLGYYGGVFGAAALCLNSDWD